VAIQKAVMSERLMDRHIATLVAMTDFADLPEVALRRTPGFYAMRCAALAVGIGLATRLMQEGS
jgi:hypothetical protein